MYKLTKNNKKYQSHEVFCNEIDLRDSEVFQKINVTIDDFNAKGEIANPRAPCVVTTIDPEYIKDASLQRKTRKFRVKTDILTLRDITRRKFMIYATQERYLEKQREAALQERIYEHLTESQQFMSSALWKLESRAFKEMKTSQQQLENLQKNKISDELKNKVEEHQRVLMEVQEIYGRFLFLHKLIEYFDGILGTEDLESVTKESEFKSKQLSEIFNLQINEQYPIEKKEISSITSYMNRVVRPYLAKRNHLNADIWIKGYECTRQKIFNFNRRFHHLALLNHLVTIINGKSKKTFNRSLKTQKFFKDPRFLKQRIEFLNQRSVEILNYFENNLKKDLIQIRLNALLPVVLENIETKLTQDNENSAIQLLNLSLRKTNNKKPSYYLNFNTFNESSHNSILEKVEKLQWYFMYLLQELEKFPSNLCSKVETEVKKRIQAEKELSRKALVKQNLLQKWTEHLKKHALLQDHTNK